MILFGVFHKARVFDCRDTLDRLAADFSAALAAPNNLHHWVGYPAIGYR